MNKLLELELISTSLSQASGQLGFVLIGSPVYHLRTNKQTTSLGLWRMVSLVLSGSFDLDVLSGLIELQHVINAVR